MDEKSIDKLPDVDKLPNYETVIAELLCDDGMRAFEYEFDSVEYKLRLSGKTLFRLPCCIGEWLFDLGYATKNYYGIRIKH